jgi:cytochrome c-type biogenesis protein CcmH/NrfG
MSRHRSNRPPEPVYIVESRRSEPNTLWMVSATAGVLFGMIAGYLIGAQNGDGRATFAGAAVQQQGTSRTSGVNPHVLDESQVRAQQNILEADPKNVDAAVKLGNLYYDAQLYSEAIPYYRQALQLKRDANVSTDLGTALWYAGQADEALKQYAESLKIDPAHANTLFNMGIVRLDGKKDAQGAVESWEQLLAKHPQYQNGAHVQELIAKAKAQL